MAEFWPYVEQLERLALGSEQQVSAEAELRRMAALDGEPSRELRKAVPLNVRREIGSFFTSASLAGKAVAVESSKLPGLLYDPACGGGDLLVAAARQLPARATLRTTLRFWGKRLAGRDVHAEFVRVTKARLVLLARERTKDLSPLSSSDAEVALSHIATGSGHDGLKSLTSVRSLLLNPPFGRVDAPADCEWSTGKVNAAAIFLDQLLDSAAEGTSVIAILPDVLRTGSRYAAWRETISRRLRIDVIEQYGVFDSATDVHVFVLRGQVTSDGSSACDWWKPTAHQQVTLSEYFDIHVGAVVPHRHAMRGRVRSYVHAKDLPRWHQGFSPTASRRFTGTVFSPPFVAIRRTSRPEDEHRAVGTIVVGSGEVAVENHLIVCRPKDGTLARCKELLKALRAETTTQFLNERIRCRHLTTIAVAEIPLV